MSKTKFKNAQTIVTDDFLNSMYGGLDGSSEGSQLPADDPRVKGHLHDGISGDGHASKIDLVSHVENQLTNTNLADAAVTKRNVYSSTDPADTNLIPHYEIDSNGVKNYYLGLGSFDLQNITDNGNETTNPIIIGNNDLTNSTMYCTMFAVNMPMTIDTSDGGLSYKKDYALSLKLGMDEVFSWHIDGPNAVTNKGSFSDGESVVGSKAQYKLREVHPFGIEQRMYQEDFGYVGFSGNESKNFHLRVIGIGGGGTYEPPIGPASYGSTSSDIDLRSFNAQQAITFWYDTDAKNAAYDREVYGGVSSYIDKSSVGRPADLIFSVRPDLLETKLSKDYDMPNPSLNTGPSAGDNLWPLFDVARISRYSNMEIKRGNQFTTHSESMLNIKETFGIDENYESQNIPISQRVQNKFVSNIPTINSEYQSRNIASIRLEPVINQNQTETDRMGGAEQYLAKFALSKEDKEAQQKEKESSDSYGRAWMPDSVDPTVPLVAHHNYIDLASIMDGRTSNFAREDLRSLSAGQDLVSHSNVFKFDRYFIDRTHGFTSEATDAHRALHNNTSELGEVQEISKPSRGISRRLGQLSSQNHYARHAMPCVDPYASEDYYAPTMMKVNVVDGNTPRDFYVPVCYPEGQHSDIPEFSMPEIGSQKRQEDVFTQDNLDESISKRNADLAVQQQQYYVFGSTPTDGSAYYWYPVLLSPPSDAETVQYSILTLAEYPGISFWIETTRYGQVSSSPPSTSDYPGIIEFNPNASSSAYDS